MASYNDGKDYIVDWICERLPACAGILDVGACDGKWADLIRAKRDDVIIDAVEIYKPNAAQILDKYERIFVGDIYDYFYPPYWYDIIIFGDVLEHMDVWKAQDVLQYALPRTSDYVIGVPFRYPQGPIDGNEWERHIQDDLTPEIFKQRYPGHELILRPRPDYAYYHRAPKSMG